MIAALAHEYLTIAWFMMLSCTLLLPHIRGEMIDEGYDLLPPLHEALIVLVLSLAWILVPFVWVYARVRERRRKE